MRFTVASLRAGSPPLSHRVLVDARNLRRGCGSIIASVLLATLFGVASPAQAGTQGASSFLITATSGSGGSISPSGNVAVIGGASITFIIAPEPCNFILDVVVDSVSVGAVANYAFNNVTADHTIAVTFGLSTHSITPSAGSGGTISPPAAVTLSCAQSQVVNIAPANCYAIFDVLVDGVSVGPVATYTFDNVNSDHTIAASFVSAAVATTTTLSSSLNPSVCLQPVSLEATVSPGSATGSVEFFEGATSLGTAAVAGGVAALAPLAYSVGSHVLTAVFTPTGCFAGSSSASHTQVVNRAASSVAVGADINPSLWAQAVTFTATITPSSATGTVTFRDSIATLGVVPVAGGVAQIVRSNLPVGLHTQITATYNGDACFATSVSAAPAQRVNRAACAVSATTDINPAQFGQKIFLTATTTPSGPTGSIRIYADGNLIGTVILNSGTGTGAMSINNLVPGSHNMTVTYPGDINFTGAASVSPYVQVITMTPTSVVMTSDVTPAKFGQVITLTATVSPNDAAGTVEFFDGATSLGTAPVGFNGVASLTLSTLTVGTHSLTAAFGDGTAYASSTSPPYTQAITPDQPPVVTVTYPNGGESVNLGSTITITWTATDNTAVNAVKVELSRNNGSSWETLGSGLSNTGSYDWSSAGAGTNPDTAHVYSALVRVTATDHAGVDGADTSDAPFSVFDLQTAVILTRLDAETVEDGVSITWGLSNPALFASLALQRSRAETGPWNDVSAQLSDDAGLTVAIDRSAAAGQSYFYRLVATTGSGTQAVFGPVRGTAGSPKAFALSAAWPNPSRGPLQLRFTVPRPARVRLSVVDLMGREVAVLVNGEQAAGRYQVDWDGRTAQGTVATGLYFLRFSTPGMQIVSRVTIAR